MYFQLYYYDFILFHFTNKSTHIKYLQRKLTNQIKLYFYEWQWFKNKKIIILLRIAINIYVCINN